RKAGEVVLALTFDYGQKAAAQEIKQAQKICAILNIPHKIVQLPWLKEITKSALVNPSVEVPVANNVQIKDLTESLRTAKAVWVPNRNGVFLNIAASFAESLDVDAVVPGFN